MKIIFLGTPKFAQNLLIDLVHLWPYKVVAVVTQPDKRVGRGGKVKASPVKGTALCHNYDVLQFKNINTPEAIEKLKSYNADMMLTVAYGQILKQEVLDITPLGVFNVHGSLLPKYRGAAPVQWAVINGETKTGLTIMKSDKGMDTGDMLLKGEIELIPDMTSGDALEALTSLATTGAGYPNPKYENGGLLLKALNLIKSENYTLTKQNSEKATYARMLKKEDGLINFNKTSQEIVNLVRGLNPAPLAYTFVNGKKLSVYKAIPVMNEKIQIKEAAKTAIPGEVLSNTSKKGLFVKTLNGAVRLSEVKLEGKKLMSDRDFLNGYSKLEKGSLLGE